jgi:phosphate starvation-inducible protein PhoH
MIARALELIRNTANSLKIIISKPAVEAEKPWILPGDMERWTTFIASSLDIFDKLIGKVKA